ncbi:hypothetical protein ES703_04121 [subsurface metagenome]
MADKKTDWGTLALIGLGVWYFLIRKPPTDGLVTPSVSITGIEASNPVGPGGVVAPGESILLKTTLSNLSTRNGEHCSLPVTVKFYLHYLLYGVPAPFKTLTKTVTLSPGTTQVVESPSFITYVRDNVEERRVIVEVWYEDVLLAQELFTGVYYVKPEPVISPSVSINSLAWSYV